MNQLAAMYGPLDTTADTMEFGGDIEIVVSELVSNAIRHDAQQVLLVLDAHHRHVTFAATDDAPGVPVKRAPPLDATSGRGLVIVDRLAPRWGVTPTERGKTVWAEFGLPSNAQPTFACTI